MGYDNKQANFQSGVHIQHPKPTGSPFNVKLLVGCCGGALVLIIGGILATVWWLKSPQGSDYIDIFPHDRQAYGERLAWRTLVELPDRQGFMGSMTVGNFDRDPEQEIMLVNYLGEMLLIELDGSIQKLADGSFDYAFWIKAWDWDADGIDEILLNDLTAKQEVVVYGLDGQPKHRFKNQRMGAYSVTGDYDGDGIIDILLVEANGPGAWIHSANGQMLEQLNVKQRSEPLMLTDLDNDGLAEAIVYEYENFKVYAYNKDPKIVDWPEVDYTRVPYWAADLTGDNVPELINPVKGILDITANLVPLQYDVALDLDFIDSPGGISCSVFRENPNGPAQLVVTPGNFNKGPIYMFDANGTMTYHQQINPEPMDCLVINFQGQDFLVVLTEEKIMIYP